MFCSFNKDFELAVLPDSIANITKVNDDIIEHAINIRKNTEL